MKTLLRFGAVVAAVLAATPRVLAQGCAMCYADAAAQSPRARHQLDLAILALLVPSVMMFAGVLIAAFRRREQDTVNPGPWDADSQTAPQFSIPAKRRGIAPGPTPDSI